ncbi:hypothetical protein HDU97_006653 [Phlyctochytrium planicorne]|nr:hypothetical protein HDU97_006653 [Phlyctochytrium planicorne]
MSDVDTTLPIFLGKDANNPTNRVAVAVIFTVLIAFFLVFFLFHFIISPWRMGRENWVKTQLQSDESVRSLRNNFWMILAQLGTFAVTQRDIQSTKGHSLMPFLFLGIIVISFILIEHAIASQKTEPKYYGDVSVPIIRTTQAQVGFILFFIGCNGYLVLRIFEYYKVKTEIRKKIAAHSYGGQQFKPETTANKEGESRVLPPKVRLNKDSQFLVANDAGGAQRLGGTEPSWSRSRTPSPEPSVSVDVQPAQKEFVHEPSEVTLQDDTISRECSEDTRGEDENFDNEFQYIRRMKHILPQYAKISLTTMNFVQILILIAEFLQLASFPYRDLLRNEDFQASLYQPFNGQIDTLGSNVVSSLQSFFNTISQGIPNTNLSSKDFTNIQFVVSWWFTLIAFTLAGIFIGITLLIDYEFILTKDPKLKKTVLKNLQGTWILVFLPLCNLFYLIILGAFVEPLGCISSSYTPLWPPKPASTVEQAEINRAAAIHDREDRCSAVLRYPEANIWFPIVGYIMCYYVFTIFKTSEDPKPREGIISFTTRSEVLNKNASLTILLLYTLIPTKESSTARGVLAIFVLAFMIFFQIRIGSSYSRPVNFWRTVSFIFVMWMSMVVVYFTHPAQRSFYGIDLYESRSYRPWMRITLTIVLGWVVIFVLYTILYFLVILKLEKQSSVPREGIKYSEGQVDEEVRWATAKPITEALSRVHQIGTSIGQKVNKLPKSSSNANLGDSTISRRGSTGRSLDRDGGKQAEQTPGISIFSMERKVAPGPSDQKEVMDSGKQDAAHAPESEKQSLDQNAERKKLHGPRTDQGTTARLSVELLANPSAGLDFGTMKSTSSDVSTNSNITASSSIPTLQSSLASTNSPVAPKRSHLRGPRQALPTVPSETGTSAASTPIPVTSTDFPMTLTSPPMTPTPPKRRSFMPSFKDAVGSQEPHPVQPVEVPSVASAVAENSMATTNDTPSQPGKPEEIITTVIETELTKEELNEKMDTVTPVVPSPVSSIVNKPPIIRRRSSSLMDAEPRVQEEARAKNLDSE